MQEQRLQVLLPPLVLDDVASAQAGKQRGAALQVLAGGQEWVHHQVAELQALQDNRHAALQGGQSGAAAGGKKLGQASTLSTFACRR